MATVVIYVPGQVPDVPRRRCTISHPAYGDVTLTITSPETDKTDLAGDWAELGRAGLAPLLVRKGTKLPKLRLEATLDEGEEANLTLGLSLDDSGHRVEGLLARLEGIAGAVGPPIAVGYGPLEAGLWRMVEFSWHALLRYPGDNHVIRATCSFGFTQASDPGTPRLPAAPPPAPSNPTPAPETPGGGPQRHYTVVAGDTLWAIAQATYGNGNVWTNIADANGIRDPRRLQIGTDLVLP